jgi:DNA-binding beta-propeller fold protein YncE
MKRFLWLGFVLCLYLICSGCGETYRPIIIPNPPVFPNPRAAHSVLSLNNNGTLAAGSAMVVDVSGDTDVSVANVGLAPVHATQQTATQVLVVNHSVSSPQNTGDSITKLSFNGTIITGSQTISLPANSAPNFVAVAPSATTAYVSLPSAAPPSVAVVNTLSNTVPDFIPVGNGPVALAVTPDNSKLYVANEGDGTISGFNTVDRSQRVGSPTHTSSPPIWLLARTDNQAVYALEANGTLAMLSTISTAGPDPLTESTIVVPNASLMIYDVNLNRLYIPGGSQIAIVDVSQSAPSLLATQSITAVLPASRSASDPCSTTAVTTLDTIDAAALPDGSRAYVGSYYEDAGNVCPQVTVIDTTNNSIKTTIAIPGFPAYDSFCATARFRIMMAAGGDSTRAYLASCDGGNVNIIDTATDTYLLNLAAPIGARPPVPPNPLNPPQNPVFLIAGP